MKKLCQNFICSTIRVVSFVTLCPSLNKQNNYSFLKELEVSDKRIEIYKGRASQPSSDWNLTFLASLKTSIKFILEIKYIIRNKISIIRNLKTGINVIQFFYGFSTIWRTAALPYRSRALPYRSRALHLFSFYYRMPI